MKSDGVPDFYSGLADEGKQFIKVAELIAKGPSPEWLLDGLVTLRPFISIDMSNLKDIKRIQQRMVDEIDHFVKWLPYVFHPGVFGVQKDIAIALVVLPRIKKLITPALQGPWRSFGPRKICADVVVQAWRRIHGEAEPRSEKVYEACQRYYMACGHEQIELENWRRDVEAAAGIDYSIASVVFEAVQSPSTI